MIGWKICLTLLLVPIVLGSFSHALIIEYGDNDRAIANETAMARCTDPGVQAVYSCLGNVVKVVSSTPGTGSTFYKADGTVVSCPVAAPAQLGADCMQMLTPNYCQPKPICGKAQAPSVFPGQGSTNQTNSGNASDVGTGAATSPAKETKPTTKVTASSSSLPAPTKPQQPNPAGVIATEVEKNQNDSPQLSSQAGSSDAKNELAAPSAIVPSVSGAFDFSLDNLILVIVGLGLVSIAVIFAMFKNSLAEDTV